MVGLAEYVCEKVSHNSNIIHTIKHEIFILVQSLMYQLVEVQLLA